MLVKTRGLVLGVAPFSRTSHIVEWLLHGYGHTAVLVKGAQRPKGGYLGQYDLFYECEVVFYDRAPRRMNVLRESAPLKLRPRLREDWGSAACASYFSALIAHAAPMGMPHDDLYELFDGALDALEARGGTLAVLCWFELALLSSIGLALSLWKCPACACTIVPRGTQPLTFSSSRGGFLCESCAVQEGGLRSPVRPSPGTLAMLRAWQAAPSAQAAQSTVPTAGQMAELASILGEFVAYHLDMPPAARQATAEILKSRPPRQTLNRKWQMSPSSIT